MVLALLLCMYTKQQQFIACSGKILSPILFSVFMVGLCEKLENSVV